jgi:hypothetical protein
LKNGEKDGKDFDQVEEPGNRHVLYDLPQSEIAKHRGEAVVQEIRQKNPQARAFRGKQDLVSAAGVLRFRLELALDKRDNTVIIALLFL